MSGVVLIICGATFVSAVFMLIRNEWVYRQAGKFRAECFDRPAWQWARLGSPVPSDIAMTYNQMMVRFWIWDREKFRRARLPEPPEAGEGM